MNRAIRNSIFEGLCWTSLIVTGALLMVLIGSIFWNGFQAVSFDFVISASRNFGAEGGVLYQIIGSLLLISVAAGLSFPIALGTALYKSEYLKNQYLQRVSDILIYGLNGIPSVVFGIFGLVLFVNILSTGISWFVGSIILGIMILPTLVLTTYQSINSIPHHYRESALALGMSKWQVSTKILLPMSIQGAFTGLLIGLARAIGETAPIMFIATAFSGAKIPGSPFEPVASLPTHILSLAQQASDPRSLENAWGASLILITLVGLFSLTAVIFRNKYKNSVAR
ncbi:phosphate ABC transporter permease PstA [Gracilimonas sp.]|uniref:phosphate ABC transporter permease PstA n=1 Tax=Gracilimonas sp. TaxID=1974203 RepID=UPI003BA9311F